MSDFTKLAGFLNSFKEDSPDYALAAVIKAKIANDLQDTSTVNNGDSEELTENDMTMSTPEQQTQSNTEGEAMAGAFPELDAMNQIKDEEENKLLKTKKASFFSILALKLKK